MKGFSAYTLCFNDVFTIEMAVRCLLRYADDVVVVDGGSTDGSVALLKKLAGDRRIKLLQRKQKGGRYESWVEQPQFRNEAVAALEHDWVITLDADECFTDDFAPAKPMNGVGMTPRYNLISPWHYIHQCQVDNGRHSYDWYPDFQARVFDRRRYSYPNHHEHCRLIETSTKNDVFLCRPELLRGAILHYRLLCRGIGERRMRDSLSHNYFCKPLPVEHSACLGYANLPASRADLASR